MGIAIKMLRSEPGSSGSGALATITPCETTPAIVSTPDSGSVILILPCPQDQLFDALKGTVWIVVKVLVVFVPVTVYDPDPLLNTIVPESAYVGADANGEMDISH